MCESVCVYSASVCVCGMRVSVCVCVCVVSIHACPAFVCVCVCVFFSVCEQACEDTSARRLPPKYQTDASLIKNTSLVGPVSTSKYLL